MLPRAVTARVAYVPGTAFFADGFGAQSMRLSYCYPTPERIREGVRRLVGVIEEELELRETFGAGRRATARTSARSRYDGPDDGPDVSARDERDRTAWWCWPAACPTSATSRCAPGAGSPRRCASTAPRSTCATSTRDLLRLLRERPARLRACRCCTASPARTARCARCSSCSDLPYVGARPAACRSAFDKPVAKEVVARHGIRTPRGRDAAARDVPRARRGGRHGGDGGALGLPLIVKPARGGSALGCTVVREAGALAGAMVGAFAYGDTALVERLVEGDEVAVPVIDTGDGPAGPARGRDRARRRRLRLHRALHRRQHGVHGAREARPTRWPRPAPGSRSRRTRRSGCATCRAPT